MSTTALKEENGKMKAVVIPDPHTQNSDYKLADYSQTIDITGLTSIDFVTGEKAITAGKNQITLTSSNTTESFTITDFPSYLIKLKPATGLTINIIPSDIFQTKLGLVISLNGSLNDFIQLKND